MRRFLWVLSLVLTFDVLLSASNGAAGIVLNGDFEAVQIGSPYHSSDPADVPNWTHAGSPGEGPLWGVGYADPFGSITAAGHGNQFVTMGGGGLAVGSASWEQTLTGLTPGGTY